MLVSATLQLSWYTKAFYAENPSKHRPEYIKYNNGTE